MSNNSIIEHRANYYYVEAREEYIEICKASTYKKKPTKKGAKSKSSPYCKALILAILENWLNNKRGKGEDLVVYMSYPQWITAMYGMFGRNVIIDSLDELIGEGLISREPYKMFGRDSFQYRLNCQELNRRIRQLPERDPNEMYPHTSLKVNATSLKVNGSDLQVNATGLKVNDDPFTKGRNIESTKKQNIESNEGTASQENDSTPTGTPSSLSSSLPSSLSSQEKELSTANVEKQASSVDNTQSPIATVTTRNTSNERNTEPLLSEARRVFNLLCEAFFAIAPEFTSKIEKQCADLAPHVVSIEDLKSLKVYARAKIKDDPKIPDKQVYLGNLVKCVDGWKQEREPLPEKPKSQTSKPPIRNGAAAYDAMVAEVQARIAAKAGVNK